METLVVVYGAGLASAASPCLLPLYPAFLAYLTGSVNADADGGQRRRISGFLGLAILAGVITVMVAVGLVFVVLKAPLGQLLALAVPAMCAGVATAVYLGLVHWNSIAAWLLSLAAFAVLALATKVVGRDDLALFSLQGLRR